MSVNSELYRIRDWGGGFFEVNGAGEVAAVLRTEDGDTSRVSLLKVIEEMDRLDLPLPAIVRFPDILAERVRMLVGAFERAMEKKEYRGGYAGCFPIKVNQKREVISEITSLSDDFQFGLEAGTKAELVAAIAHMRDRKAHLVCNGYKDETFVDLALYATKAGIKVVIVIERASELPLILERARALNATPRLGVRIRINASGAGRWSSTAGGQGQFGLSPLELISAVDCLRKEGMLECLYMLHYHQGSQIPDINTVRRGVEEAANLYVELAGEGARLGALNIGGGLAIDYEGASVISNSSKNYLLADYCEAVVEIVRDYMDANDLAHPKIISESGRAICAHYSTLVFSVLDAGTGEQETCVPPGIEAPKEVRRLYEIFNEPCLKNAQDLITEVDALNYHCRLSFAAGACTLRDLSAAEHYRNLIVGKIGKLFAEDETIPRSLGTSLSRYYFANFSVFQSLPDSWAIGQLFPIMPIHRLNEVPAHEGIVADITCDCDGKINRYIGARDEWPTLPLHALKPGEPYYLGAFLVGAYQETLGDIHNLFGRPTVVSVRVHDGKFQFENINEGDTITGVLNQVDYTETDLFDGLTDLADGAHSEGRISGGDRNAMVRLFGEMLNSYTYLNPARSRPVEGGADPEEVEILKS